jgi:RNA polymerase sigma-70 factor (sigma-E family)
VTTTVPRPRRSAEVVPPAEPALDFEEYVRSRRPALLRMAHAVATDHDSAEDLLHCALSRVFLRWDAIRDRGAADAYVRRAMVNQQASWYRQGWRTRERATAVLPEPRRDAVATSPEVDERQRLWTQVRALPPGQRAAVALRFYEGLSVEETARVLGLSPGTVKSSTSRGLAALRRGEGR